MVARNSPTGLIPTWAQAASGATFGHGSVDEADGVDGDLMGGHLWHLCRLRSSGTGQGEPLGSLAGKRLGG